MIIFQPAYGFYVYIEFKVSTSQKTSKAWRTEINTQVNSILDAKNVVFETKTLKKPALSTTVVAPACSDGSVASGETCCT